MLDRGFFHDEALPVEHYFAISSIYYIRCKAITLSIFFYAQKVHFLLLNKLMIFKDNFNLTMDKIFTVSSFH